jgi:hypothetical protein
MSDKLSIMEYNMAGSRLEIGLKLRSDFVRGISHKDTIMLSVRRRKEE